MREAPVEEIEDAIRPGGLAPTKSVRIQQILEAIGDDDLAHLAERAARRGARATSARCPGVGRKTAACVLLFSFGRPDVPVDTHVYRVGGAARPLARAGRRSRRRTTSWLRLCGDDGEFAYEAHVLLIRHGRRTCVARAPRCAECPLRRMCPEGRRRLAGGMSETTLRRGSELALIGDRGGLGPDLRDGAGRDRAAADDGVPRLPLHPRRADRGADLLAAAARAAARRAGAPAC